MKFNIQRSLLIEALSFVRLAADTRSAYEPCHYLYLACNGRGLFIAGTDSFVLAQYFIPAEPDLLTVSRGGEVFIHPDTLLELLKNISEGTLEITVTTTPLMQISVVRQASSHQMSEWGFYELFCPAPQDFPFKTETTSDHILLPTNYLKELLKNSAYAASKKELERKPVIKGIHLEVLNEVFSAETTDTYRSVRIHHPLPKSTNSEQFHLNVTLPYNILKLLSALKEDSVSISKGATTTAFSCGNIFIQALNMTGTFPDLSRKYEEKTSNRFEVSAADMIRFIETMERCTLSKDETIRLTFNEESLHGTVNNEMVKNFSQSIPCQYNGEQTDYILNADYILQAVKSMSGTISGGFNTTRSPMILYCGDSQTHALIAPSLVIPS